jgi:tetratricopeptide (TPR) repeat protein
MKRLSIVLVFFLLLAVTAPVHADVAPPEQPPGANPGPGSETTQVRMQSESVLIDVQAKAPAKSMGQALVTADFTMHNLGSQDETMDVRFPISGNDGWQNYPEISDFQVSVNGNTVDTWRTTGSDPFGFDDTVPWAAFTVTFPAGQDTKIKVTYTLEASGSTPDVWFYYIFSTGAGWKDSIGSAEMTVRLPYPVNEQNIVRNSVADYGITTGGGTISGNEMHWSFTNLEPTAKDNFKIELVQPSVWETVLDDQAAVAQNPNDGEAWGMLGKQYKQLLESSKGRGFRTYHIATDFGAQNLYALSQQAYDKAVTLKPKDPLWHAGYADLLGFYAYYGNQEQLDTTADAVHALSEIRLALKLAPGDDTVNQIANMLTAFFPEGMISNGAGYNFPWLTVTPTAPEAVVLPLIDATPTPPETITAVQTAVSKPVPTATQPPAATQAAAKPKLPFCGAVVLPLGAVLLALWLRKAHV